jgi:hypothetical protein
VALKDVFGRVLISIKLPHCANRLSFWTTILGGSMQDGFPHGVAIGLGLVRAVALAVFVFVAWGGLLH